jgi:sortase A
MPASSRPAPAVLPAIQQGLEEVPPQAAADRAGAQDQVPWTRPSIRRPELQRASRASAIRSRRPITFAEVLILGLSMSIVGACLFIAYAFVYRLQVGPGMEVPTMIAAADTTATVAALPTLVPTYTPTALATKLLPTAVGETPAPPTPIPEPTLPLPPTPTPIIRIPATSPPTRLVIPSLSLEVPVVPVGIKTVSKGGTAKVVWADAPNAGAFHQTSAYPGNPGNTVINGHRDILGSVFRHLDRVRVGDEILLYVGDEEYAYLVAETLIVPETFASAEQRTENLRLIGYMPEERLTLVTCTPVGLATHRLLVIAKPLEEMMPQMPEAGANSVP